jgi:hypothetical protein
MDDLQPHEKRSLWALAAAMAAVVLVAALALTVVAAA